MKRFIKKLLFHIATLNLLFISPVMAESQKIKFPLSRDKISVIIEAIERTRKHTHSKYDVLLEDCGDPLFRKQIFQNATWKTVEPSNVVEKNYRKANFREYFDKTSGKRIEKINVRLESVSSKKILIEVFSDTHTSTVSGAHSMRYTYRRINGKWVLKEEKLGIVS